MKYPMTLNDLAALETRAPAETLDDRRFTKIIEDAMKMKRIMIKKNLTRARVKCCFCAGKWHAVLHPNRRDRSRFHIHIACDGIGSIAPCNVTFME